MLLNRAAALAVFASALTGPAWADEFTSAETTVALDACTQSGNVEDGARWTCPGYGGTTVLISHFDPRFTIAFGEKAAEQRAAEQSPGAFNTLFKAESQTATLIWRLTEMSGRSVPVAAIVRFYTEGGGSTAGKTGEVLAVIKLGLANGTEACHVARIDALANPDALALAERAADNAAKFNCMSEPVIIGKTGVSPIESEGGEE